MQDVMTQERALRIAEEIYEQAKLYLSSKLDAVVVFGSFARNDFDKDSDLDIMVRILCSRADLEKYEDFFCKLASRASLQYDITISIVLSDAETFFRYKTALPFYRNIEQEGIRIA